LQWTDVVAGKLLNAVLLTNNFTETANTGFCLQHVAMLRLDPDYAKIAENKFYLRIFIHPIFSWRSWFWSIRTSL